MPNKMKSVPADKKGLAKLPTTVRNKMGYKAKGGKATTPAKKKMYGGMTAAPAKKKMMYGGKTKKK